tara:strand:- start:440 stop:1111 length:672 start_codon:yes stop_codon:yes gene_type:complete
MSWNRTVYCSYCGKKGHNRQGCPTRKAYIAQNPDSYEARREAAKKTRARRCSYCGDAGHTRRTCAALKTDVELWTTLAIEMRRRVFQYLSRFGIGVGTLVRTDRYEGGLFFIKEVSWVNITPHRFSREVFEGPAYWNTSFIQCSKTARLGVSGAYNSYYFNIGDIRIASAIDKNLIQPPDGWFTATDKKSIEDRDEHFKQRDMGTLRWRMLHPLKESLEKNQI